MYDFIQYTVKEPFPLNRKPTMSQHLMLPSTFILKIEIKKNIHSSYFPYYSEHTEVRTRNRVDEHKMLSNNTTTHNFIFQNFTQK